MSTWALENFNGYRDFFKPWHANFYTAGAWFTSLNINTHRACSAGDDDFRHLDAGRHIRLYVDKKAIGRGLELDLEDHQFGLPALKASRIASTCA